MVAEQTLKMPNQHTVVQVPNQTHGGNIGVAGLLMVEDFIKIGKQALEQHPEIELILVPSKPFDSLNQDLCGVPAHRISDHLKKPV